MIDLFWTSLYSLESIKGYIWIEVPGRRTWDQRKGGHLHNFSYPVIK